MKIPGELQELIRHHFSDRLSSRHKKCYKDILLVQKYVIAIRADRDILMKAVMSNDIASVQLQIQMNTGMCEGLLEHACMYKFNEIAEILIKKSSREELFEGFLIACIYGNAAIVKIMVKVLTLDEIRANNNEGFKRACQYNYPEIVKILFPYLSKRDIQSDCGFIFVQACTYNKKEIVEILLPMVDVRTLCNHNIEGFISACSLGNAEIVKILLGVLPPEDIFAREYTAFKYACRYGRVDIVEMLLELLTEDELCVVYPDLYIPDNDSGLEIEKLMISKLSLRCSCIIL